MPSRRLVLVSVLLLAGCGGGASTAPDATDPATTAPAAADGPAGTLGFEGIGEARRGASVEEVEALFGEPTSSDTMLDCELSGTNAREQTVLSYETPEGVVALSFYPEGLSSYRSESTTLETAEGISVGDPYDDLAAAVENLKPIDLGAEATAEQGLWSVEQSPTARMTYEIDGGEVIRILGGDTIICE